MNYAYDLHIHSALSPCAEKDMTPNNIVNMAVLKGLDVIAVTDHNTCGNIEAVARCADKAGLLFIPGIEIETAEEIHLICLLPDIKRAHELHMHVKKALPTISNRADIFGSQLIIDENDEVTGECEQMLMTAASLTIDDVCLLARQLGGAVLPAHIDRPSYSILSNLGFIPENLAFKSLEISRNCRINSFLAAHPGLEGCNLVKSSDAHRLGDIMERESFLELEYLSVQQVIDALK